MDIALPSVIYRGRVLRVHSTNCIEVSLDLRFGVHIDRNVLLEGVAAESIPPGLREDAMYCLILMLAKRAVLVHTDDSQRDGFVKGRIFIAEEVKCCPVPLLKPYGVAVEMVEVSSFYQWLGGKNYDYTYAAKLYGNNVPPRNKARKAV